MLTRTDIQNMAMMTFARFVDVRLERFRGYHTTNALSKENAAIIQADMHSQMCIANRPNLQAKLEIVPKLNESSPPVM
jgi:hypothetical protein